MRPPDPRETLVELPALRLARWLAEASRLGAAVVSWHLPDEPAASGLAHVRVVDLPLTLHLALETDTTATLFESVVPDIWLAVAASAPVPDLAASVGVYRLVRADGRVDSFASPRPPETAVGTSIRAVTPAIASHPSTALTVTPRLRAHSRADTPGLWVLEGDALPGFTRIVREMDETQMLLWQFAVGSHKGQLRVVLRPAHRRKCLQLFLPDVPAYVAHLPVSQLFLPAGMALRPMPRPDVLRKWVRTKAERVYWLDAHPEGIAVESIPEAAFRPLRDWVVWKSTSPVAARVGWTDLSASLRPEGFQALLPARERPESLAEATISVPPSPTTPLRIPDTRPRREGRSWVASLLMLPLLPLIVLLRALRKPRKPVEPEPPEIDMAAAVRTAMAPLADRLERPEVDAAPGRKNLQELENTLIQRLDKLSPRELADIWPGLAAGYHQADNHADSAICSLLALWDHPTLQAELTWGWFRSEATQAAWNPRHVDLNRRLQMPATPAMVRALAAYVVQNLRGGGEVPESLRPHLPTIQTLLEDHETHLTIRAVWLVRTSLAKVGGGDVLSLARTRDRLVDRLRIEGLRPDRDLPACLGAGASNIDRYRQVRSWLGEHRDPIQQWIARQARPGSAPGLASVGLEAETKFTAAYADLMLAWGLTRLSDYPAADRLRANALHTLAVDDPVHSLLRDMWLDRIDRAREQVPEAAFAEPILQRFAKLSQSDRYVVEKWLERSRILEPNENRGAYRPTVARYGGELEKTLYALSEERDADRVQAAVRDLLARTAPEQMATAVPLLLDLHGRLGGVFRREVYPRARALLDDLATPSAVRQAVVERGMLAAAACDEPDLVRALADWLRRYLDTRPGGSLVPYEMLSKRLLRCLRRLGMKSETAGILDGAAKAVLKGYGPSRVAEFHPKETPLALRLLAMIAGGWYSAGANDRAGPLLDHVRTQWQSTTLPPAERTKLAQEYAGVLGQVPAAQALARMEELFATLGRIQNTGTTNRYYNLKVLEVVESVVLTVVSDEFALGPMVRGWLDDEEFRIRQRIRADLNAMLEEQGLV